MKKTIYHAVGMMSGTSLDGLDIAYACFEPTDQEWKYRLLSHETYAYPDTLTEMLARAGSMSAIEFVVLDIKLGEFMAEQLTNFMKRYQCDIDLIANHGHTIFHRPHIGFSTQIGHGPTIAAKVGIPVVDNFRSLDVALGGQGAPLVPIGDRLLFGEYHYCLNLGGICNISFENDGSRIAFDIGGCNIILNSLAQELEKPFDKNGDMAKEGKLIKSLFNELNALPYFQKPFPKSLGREWVDQAVFPIIEESDARVKDKLCTVCHHIAYQINRALELAIPQTSKKGHKNRLLITGGGAHNKFLIELINTYSPKIDVTVPDSSLINFKEALIFAFLGVLRWRGEVNTLRSVTGANRDACGGVIHRG